MRRIKPWEKECTKGGFTLRSICVSFPTSDASFQTFVFSLAPVPFRRAEETVSARHRTDNSPSKQLVSDPKIFLP